MQRIQYLVALLAGATLTGGCEPVQDDRPGAADAAEWREATEDDAADDAAHVDDLAAPRDPVLTSAGWTNWTSEENPPVSCDGGSMVNQFGCSGRYCDNVRLYCTPTGAAAGGAYWTTYFSEEGTDHRECESRHWMSAIACRGRYCDNISIQCTHYPNVAPKNCYWTGWISEEGGGTLWFGPNSYARGVQCDGSYCDNKRFLVCQP